ncbi:MAG TPA: alpha/beta hydrolase [Xanthomonadales bacterium]|nr:alpha/beta hydrolase [Xanthomonadales bacterium]
MHTIELKNGSRLAYRDQGEGPAILLVHGWGVSGELFDEQLSELSGRFRIIVPDLPGHGASSLLPENAGFSDLADALAELLRQLSLDAVCLVGWSLGAMVCWDLLNRHSGLGVNGLVTIDMVPRLLNDSDWQFGLREGTDYHAFDRDIELILSDWPAYTDMLAPRWLGAMPGSALPGLLERVKVSARSNQAQSMANIWKLLVEQDQRSALSNIQQPTLVVMGGQSSLYDVPAGEWIVSQMPRARLEIFRESGHAPNLDQPTRFNQLLADFTSTLNAQ